MHRDLRDQALSNFTFSSEELQGLSERPADRNDAEGKSDGIQSVSGDHPIIATETVNIFTTLKDWRSFNLKVVDQACVPGGIWDQVMKKVHM